MSEQKEDRNLGKKEGSHRLSWLHDLSEKLGGNESEDFQAVLVFFKELEKPTFDIDKQNESRQKVMVLKGILLAADARGTDVNLGGFEGETREFLAADVNQEVWLDFLKILLRHKENFQYQIAVFASLMKDPQVAQELFPEATLLKSEYQIVLSHKHWDLCDKSERRLDLSLTHGAVLNVDGFLLIKFFGRFTALCLKDSISSNGNVFIKGCFYTPVDSNIREDIKNRFYTNSSRDIKLNNPEQWLLMRPLELSDQSTDSYLDEIEKKLQKLSQTLPARIMGKSRKDAASEFYEDEIGN
ncbi:MAG: hypothetical protein ABI425_05145 [Patescibacteria group bacterium]